MVSQFQSLKLRLLNIGYVRLDSHWNYNNVISPYTRLYLITKGEAYVYHHNQKINLLPGKMYLIPSYTYSSYKCDVMHEQYYINFFEELGNGMSIYNFVNFKYEVEATTLDELFFKRLLEINPNRSLTNNDPEYYDNYPMLFKFENKNAELSNNNYLETHGTLKILLSKFFDETTRVSKDKSQRRINGVLNYISENLHNTLTVKNLANFCNLSVDHFSRKFKTTFGVRPIKYIQFKRVERAVLLLRTTTYSLDEISNTLGFENTNYFTRVFKKHMNITPTAFRKQELKK